MIFLSYFLIILSCVICLLSAVFLVRARDSFVMFQAIKMISFYGFPLFLLGFLSINFSFSLLVKVLIVIVLNFIVVIFIHRFLIKNIVEDKINIDAKVKNLVKKKRKGS